MGANDNQTVQAIAEAESYPGPSIVIAYSHCIAHGFEMRDGLAQQKLAVDCGHWPLFRYDPRRTEKHLPPLRLDSKEPRIPVATYLESENRFRQLAKTNPDRASEFAEQMQGAVIRRYKELARLAGKNSAAPPSIEPPPPEKRVPRKTAPTPNLG
jgi:pyruvate-ferredoxin/flavodoxin oxidoreductase